MILIAGGTSTLGKELVPRLVSEGHDVRVLTRDPARAKHLPKSVEIVTGDIRDAAAVVASVRDCETVVSAMHGFIGPGKPSPEAIDREGNRVLIGAASNAGVKHFVLISGCGVAPDHPMSLHRAKYAAEQELLKSGLPFTILRPTAFLETWLMVIGSELATKGHALVFGPGQNLINFVSVRDVALRAVLAVREGPISNEPVDILGPQNLPFVAVAERLIEASGKPGRIKHVPLSMLRAMSVLARPFSPMFARQAKAAVVMNTTDMTFGAPKRDRAAFVSTTTLTDLLPMP